MGIYFLTQFLKMANMPPLLFLKNILNGGILSYLKKLSPTFENKPTPLTQWSICHFPMYIVL